uniref:Ig-like domain-containing protein n=1 Tax=Seriola lalandi dorsalis TaxID=1841481 RepID=A0A3B4X6Z0_SERLL
ANNVTTTNISLATPSLLRPPVLAAARGNDVTMQCQLQLSHDEKMLTVPVLYWLRLTPGHENLRLWRPSVTYKERVALLDKNSNSTNKSILLRNVQWADSGKYLCKLSITTEKGKSDVDRCVVTEGFKSRGWERISTCNTNACVHERVFPR